MPATRSTADAILQEDYQPLVREQINNEVPLLTYVEKNSKDIDGRRAVLSLHVARNAGIGARAEGGALPSAGNQGFAEERVPLKYNYGVGAITGPLLRSADSGNSAAFERALDGETRRIVNDLKRDVNRQIWGTSDGVIARCGATTNSVTVNLHANTTDVQFRQIEVPMFVDIGTVANPTSVASNLQVTATTDNPGAYTITVSSAVTTATTDYVFRAGSGGSGSDQKELTGLQTIVNDSGALFNVDPATYPVWKAVRDHNNGTNRSISEALMVKVCQNVQIKSGEWPNLAVAHHGVFRAYANLLLNSRRYVNTTDPKGGYTGGLAFIPGGGSEFPIVVDRDCPANSVYFLNTNHLVEYQMSDWEFMQEDGAVLSRASGKDQYEFVLFKYSELATDQRNAHGVLQDITPA